MIQNKSDLVAYLEAHHTQHGEYQQAVLSWFDSIEDSYLSRDAHLREDLILRMIEPDRGIRFTVPWHNAVA